MYVTHQWKKLLIQLHPLSAPFAGQARYCAVAVRAPHALAAAQCFCHSPGSSFLSAATLCIMLHFLMKQVTFFFLWNSVRAFSLSVLLFCSSRGGAEQEEAESCGQWPLCAWSPTVYDTESGLWKRFYEGQFPHLHQIDFYLSQPHFFPIRVENYFILLRSTVIIKVCHNSLVPFLYCN